MVHYQARNTPIIDEILDPVKSDTVLAHRRVGDLIRCGYPQVSERSYLDAAKAIGVEQPVFVTEENPLPLGRLDASLSWAPDFFRLTRAEVLFRGNSTFSWMAANLCDGRVLSPIIEGLYGGIEHDCKFVEGNWPRFCNLDFVTDLHISE